MFGHGCFSDGVDFCDGLVGVLGVVGVVDVEVDVEPLLASVALDAPEPVLVPVLVVPVVAGAAAAPAMPAAAPPEASAPATIVAPSIFEIFIGLNLHGWGMDAAAIVRDGAKREGRRFVGVV
jgi:hypothetical protein